MAITKVGTSQLATAASSSVGSARTPGATGNLIVVSGMAFGGSTLTISDTAGNTWVEIFPRTTWYTGGAAASRAWYALANGTSSTTITVAASSASNTALTLDEFTAAEGFTSPLDKYRVSTGTTGNAESGAVTIVYNDELIWGCCGTIVGITGRGAGYTLGADDASHTLQTEYKINTGGAGNSENANWTNTSAQWCAGIGTFYYTGATLSSAKLVWRLIGGYGLVGGPTMSRTVN